jgi:peroxiredoxin
MIRHITLLYLLLGATFAFAKNTYTVSGQIENAGNASVVYLYYPVKDKYVADSCSITNNRFSFSGVVEEPVMATLELRTQAEKHPDDTFNFYLENAPISIKMDRLTKEREIAGSHTQDLHEEFLTLIEPLQEEMNNIRIAYQSATPEQQASEAFNETLMLREKAIYEKNSESIYRFVKEHPKDFISLHLLQSQLANNPEDEQVLTAFSSLSESIRTSASGKTFAEKLKKLQAVSLGASAPAFEWKDMDGNPVKLSDFKGKFLLLQFWASDCSHCIAELPTLKTLYHQQNGDDFAILAIALDSSNREQEWEAFVKSNNLPWLNMFDERVNGKKKIAGLYNISQTPSNFLLNKDGQIIAKNLYGDDLLGRVSAILRLSHTFVQ